MKELDPINAAKVVFGEHLLQKTLSFFADLIYIQWNGDLAGVNGAN